MIRNSKKPLAPTECTFGEFFNWSSSFARASEDFVRFSLLAAASSLFNPDLFLGKVFPKYFERPRPRQFCTVETDAYRLFLLHLGIWVCLIPTASEISLELLTIKVSELVILSRDFVVYFLWKCRSF